MKKILIFCILTLSVKMQAGAQIDEFNPCGNSFYLDQKCLEKMNLSKRFDELKAIAKGVVANDNSVKFVAVKYTPSFYSQEIFTNYIVPNFEICISGKAIADISDLEFEWNIQKEYCKIENGMIPPKMYVNDSTSKQEALDIQLCIVEKMGEKQYTKLLEKKYGDYPQILEGEKIQLSIFLILISFKNMSSLGK